MPSAQWMIRSDNSGAYPGSRIWTGRVESHFGTEAGGGGRQTVPSPNST